MSKNEKESALIVALRALIMLGSLLALPYLAITDSLPTDGLWQRVASGLEQGVVPRIQSLIQGAEPSHAISAPPDFRRPGMSNVLLGAARRVEPAILPSGVPVRLVDHKAIVYRPGRIVEMPPTTKVPATKATQEIERRLQALGAVGYHLEEWGVTGQMYRFVCEVAIEDHRQVRRHFEALGETPFSAMQQVLEEIRARTDNTQTDNTSSGQFSAPSALDR